MRFQDGQIGPIHCIRFFSMCWVVLGHLAGTIPGVVGMISMIIRKSESSCESEGESDP